MLNSVCVGNGILIVQFFIVKTDKKIRVNQ